VSYAETFRLGGQVETRGKSYCWLGFSNLSLPLNTKERLLANQFDAGGAFAITNPPNQNWRQGFLSAGSALMVYH